MADRPQTTPQYKADAIATARLHIARRIARFCTSLSPAEFEQLLDKMVHIHWKYDVLPHLDPLLVHDHKSTIDIFVAEDG
ncbi:MAG TPA: hypothetical protein VJ840_15080 [Gemmatimonadaceae bacterium]|nr:hypothetical protein [Gemmatimonadaceae bacterium]